MAQCESERLMHDLAERERRMNALLAKVGSKATLPPEEAKQLFMAAKSKADSTLSAYLQDGNQQTGMAYCTAINELNRTKAEICEKAIGPNEARLLELLQRKLTEDEEREFAALSKARREFIAALMGIDPALIDVPIAPWSGPTVLAAVERPKQHSVQMMQ